MDKTTTERGEAAGAAESNPKSSPTNVPSTTDTTAKQSSSAPPLKQPKKRTKTGCLTCRKRRIKCGEEKPRCKNCTKANRECVWYPHQITSRNSLGFLATSNSPLTPGLSPMAWPHQASQLTDGQRSHAYQRLLAPRMSPTAEPTGFSSGISDPSLVRFPHQTSPSNDPHIETRPFHLPQDNAGPLYTTESLPNENAAFGAMNSSAAGFPRSYKAPHDPLASLHGTHSGIPGDIGQHSQQLSPNELLTRESSFSTQTENRSPHDVGQSPSASVSQIHPRAQVQDHDGIDLESDVDMEEEQTPVAGSNQLSMIMASAGQDGGLIRSYTAFLNKPNILTSYRPSLGSSPLNNPVTARIWVHFIHATGPSLSIWERHHINSSIFFTGHVPASQQGLWNYTMPLRSLEHPALLQAILAVSSLHVSKLQEAPLTVPLRHYHYSLRRLWKALSLPLRRKDVATLATTLVLGFFEVMAAEHVKWNSHVAGAVQLIKEIDFTRLTRDLRIYRREAKARKQDRWGLYDSSTSHVYNEDDPFAEKEAEVSDAVLSVLSGNPVNYDQAGHVESDDYQSSRKPYFTAKDIEEFRIQCDLYWWYCKQDLFQALISGNELFLPYNQWTQCPPRAGLGKADALYGSFDHLVLLLGRLVDFGFRDRKRKLKALEKFGGEWRPHQGFLRFLSRFAAKPSGAGHPGPPADTDGVGQHPYPGADSSTRFSPSSPEFPQAPQPGHQTSLANHGDLAFDMLSNAGHNQIPVMPAPMGQSTPYSESPREDLDQSLAEAELEWEAINGAFDFFPQQLGPEFAPLPADSVAPMASPFGPAVQYRSQQIAVLWAFYYTGRIVLNRFHPCMPPAAMVAAFTAAATTEEYAMLIGKIMAGIYYSQQYSLETGSVNPTLGAILIDMCLPMFFAGVQFMDKAQREWTISTLRSISRLTGWQSAAAIATGCETAWRSAAKAGKGPPYSPPETFSSFESSHKGRIYRGPLADKQVDIQDSNAIADRRFVKVAKPARTRWAMGLLEMEEDLVNLSLDDRPGSRT